MAKCRLVAHEDGEICYTISRKDARRCYLFIGREDDLAQLSGLWEKRVASLVTCRGRRRVGKFTLIEEFAKRMAEGGDE